MSSVFQKFLRFFLGFEKDFLKKAPFGKGGMENFICLWKRHGGNRCFAPFLEKARENTKGGELSTVPLSFLRTRFIGRYLFTNNCLPLKQGFSYLKNSFFLRLRFFDFVLRTPLRMTECAYEGLFKYTLIHRSVGNPLSPLCGQPPVLRPLAEEHVARHNDAYNPSEVSR